MNKRWKVKTNGASAKIVPVDGTGTIATIIVTSKGTPEEKFENARLIAAAPEMLEALKFTEKWMKETGKAETMNELHTHICEVIAKATGK